MKPWAVVYLNYAGSHALVRGGRGVSRALVAVAGDDVVWTPIGRGWLVPGAVVDDFEALAQFHHLHIVITPKRPRWEAA
jgi:hypothetical protein